MKFPAFAPRAQAMLAAKTLAFDHVVEGLPWAAEQASGVSD